jgi:hypothetical protein
LVSDILAQGHRDIESLTRFLKVQAERRDFRIAASTISAARRLGD